MTYEIDIVHEEPHHLAVTSFETDVEHIGERMGAAFGTVAGELARAGVVITGAAVGWYEIRPDGFTVDAGFEVEPEFSGSGAVTARDLPACDAVTTVHVGPYEGLGAAYDAVSEYATAHGRRVDEAHMWEEYLDGPEVPPEETRTRVVWPLQPA